jgi:hypothetical protein
MDPESPSEPSKTSSESLIAETSARADPIEVTKPLLPRPPAASRTWSTHEAEGPGRTSLGADEPPSLERELEVDEGFAIHGWHRMIDLVDYISARVDGRLTGVLVTKMPETFTRVLGLASALKAALQWFQLDDDPRPRFVVEAEKYLAEQPLNQPIVAPMAIPPNGAPMSIRSGPVVAKKGGRGPAGRQDEVTALKAALVDLIEPLSQEDLHVHQRAFRDISAPRPSQKWVPPVVAAELLVFRIPNGTFAEMLREQGFLWESWDKRLAAVAWAMLDVLDDADISDDSIEPRTDRLNEVAQQMIARALLALGVTPDKDLFRRRRS